MRVRAPERVRDATMLTRICDKAGEELLDIGERLGANRLAIPWISLQEGLTQHLDPHAVRGCLRQGTARTGSSEYPRARHSELGRKPSRMRFELPANRGIEPL